MENPANPPEHANPAIVDFFALIITILIGLLMVEAVLRIKNHDQKNYTVEIWKYSNLLEERSLDPDLEYEQVPNKSEKLQNVDISLNSYGIRGPEPNLSDTKRKRILFLGNANTLGWGVKEDKTLPALIQKKFHDGVQVFNAGVVGYNANSYVALFQRKLRKLKPDVVVVQFFAKDADPVEPAITNFFLKNSQLALTVKKISETNKKEKETLNDVVKRYRAIYDGENEDFIKMRSALDTLDILSGQDGFKVILLMTPENNNLKDYKFDFVNERMKKVCDELGWEYVDTLKPLQSVRPERLLSIPGDPHYNALGDEIMANVLFHYLREDLSGGRN